MISRPAGRTVGHIGVVIAAALLALAAAIASAQPEARFEAPRIVAVGDVHGAYTALTELLEATGIVDAELAWTGGESHLVSLGDLLDRGPDSRMVMDLLMRLEREAAAAGGRVHVVLGNHELMNLTGDLRYVSAAEYAAFADEDPRGARREAFARFAAERGAEPADEVEARFAERYPAGYFGHRAAFAADGEYGAWLASRPAIVVVNDTAFVHGGLSGLVAQSGAAVNDALRNTLHRYLDLRERLAEAGVLPAWDMQNDIERARAALESVDADSTERAMLLEQFLALAEAPELGPEGPLWYRGSVYCNAIVEEPVLEAALAALDASSVVVGHTPTGNRRVRALYNGRLVMLDTGMLADYYAGRPAALVIDDDERRVQYLAPAERTAVESGALLAYGLTEAELLGALAAAAVESTGSGSPASARLVHEGTTLEAAFYGRRGGAAEHELAAFALDRLLGLGLVPPTVAREIDGEPGALQLRYADGISEAERLERRQPLGWCPIEPQVQLMYALDLLAFNTSRTQQTLRYRNDLSNLVLVDHRDAFTTQRELPGALDGDTLAFPAALVDALEKLDEPTLEAELGAWLDRRQIRALLARRDALVELDLE